MWFVVMMLDDGRHNLLVGGAIAVGCLILFPFVVALPCATGGEVVGALGSVLGGIVGAGGAVLTVFLLIDRQRQEEADRVTKAIRMEIMGFSKFLIGALECCEYIKSGHAIVPKKNAQSMMIKLDPIVYKSIADRVSLLPFPHQAIAFYIRLVEVQAAIQMIVESPGDGREAIPVALAETIAESLITACQLAGAIIEHAPSPSLDERVSQIETTNIRAALEQAKQYFPDAESFKEAA